MSLRLLNTERNHLLSPRPHSPRRDGCSSPLRPSPSRKAMARGGLERSLSFKNWEA